MIETTEWVDEGIKNHGKVRVMAYKDATERSVIFYGANENSAPALRAHQVRELIDWLVEWLAENE